VPGGEPVRVTDTPTTRSTFLDEPPLEGEVAWYTVRAVDTSLNESQPSSEIGAGVEDGNAEPSP
jgi:hypothetical protein